MATGYILYNEKAGTGKIADAMQALKAQLKGELKLVDVLKLTDYAAFVQNLTEKTHITAGGQKYTFFQMHLGSLPNRKFHTIQKIRG
jgi:hypothetical protein